MTSCRYMRRHGEAATCANNDFSHFLVDHDRELSSDEESCDSVTPAMSAIRSLPPHLRRLIRRSPSGRVNRSAPPAVEQRIRPRMWMQTPTAPGTNSSHKKRKFVKEYESDDEENSSSDDDDDDDDECILPDVRSRPPANKKARRIYSALTIRGTPRWLSEPRRKTTVTFSKHLVTDVWKRPRTTPEEKCVLFYRKADVRKFREEYRRERRLRIDGQWESDDDEEPLSLVTQSITASAPQIVTNATMTKKKTERSEGIHQVTESSSSNEEEESDDSSTSASQPDENGKGQV